MTTETVEEVNPAYLEMSDEDIMAMDPSVLDAPAQEPVVAAPAEAVESEPEVATQEVTEVQDEADNATTVADAPVVDKDPVAATPDSKVDYQAEYTKIFAPFKANGKEIAVSNADDAISLMQMGANYNKKMAALKPNLKLMKMLENSGLLSEEKISYLIDLGKQDPAAISKLVKDSGLDHMDLDTEKANEYKPKTYTVDDREMELDAVLDEIQGTPTYNRTLDIVSTKWDGPSKQVIAGSPQLLKVINNHMQSGIYDIIHKEVESERMFGRLNGLSDIEAYRQVGDVIQSRGGFDRLGHQGQQVPPPTVIVPKPKIEDDKLRDKKRAASSTKPAGSSSLPVGFNPLAMSDEEFSKQVNSKFL